MLDAPVTSLAWPEFVSPVIRSVLDTCRQKFMASIPAVPEEAEDRGDNLVPDGNLEPPGSAMKKEEDRLTTFFRWPNTSPVSSERLARAGFFYTHNADAVQCFACSGILDKWNLGDDVMKRHRKTFPDCAFVRGSSDNIPYLRSGLDSRLHLLESMDSGLDRSVSRPPTPSSSIHLLGSRDDGYRNSSRYGSSDGLMRSLNRRNSVLSGAASDNADVVTDGLDMKLEENRRSTFAKWPISFISAADLVASGFYFTGFQDRVRCVFCSGTLGTWQLGDNPFAEHRKHFPWCNFGKRGGTSEYSSAQSSPTGNGDTCGPFAAPPPSSMPSRFPCSPYLNTYQARLATFKNWPPNRLQTPEHLAYAGFFYTGVNDNVRCFFCDGGLRCWDPADEAWQEHSKWFPKCPYLLETKGQEYVESIQRKMDEAGDVTVSPRPESVPTTPTTDEEVIVKRVLEMGFAQPSVEQALRERQTKDRGDKFRNVEELMNGVLEVENKKKRPEAKSPRPSSGLFARLRSLSRDSEKDVAVEKLAEENRILKQQRRCKICLDRDVSTVFLPCGHLISCGECAPSLRTCSLCRKVIRGTVKTYLS